MKPLLYISTVLGYLLILAGCGGGNTASNTPLPTGSIRGSASFTVRWPAQQRLIPNASQSIVVTISQGATQLQQQVLQRPSGAGTTTGSFTLLPVGSLTVTATAYPNIDGTGTAQANATIPVTIEANKNTPLTITMNSTIDHLTLSPNPATVIIGSTLQMSATAYDASGAIVLLSAPKLQWKSSNTTFATVDQNGNVSGLGAGSPVITVTDSESGKSASETITSRAVSPVTFGSPTLYAVNAIPQEIMIGDMDGDGKPDLVVGTESDLEILYGNGDGTFQPAKVILTYSGGVSPWSLADMNGDGLPDITCTVYSAVLVVPNRGGRSFGAPTLVPMGDTISGMVVAKFTSGPLPDFAVVVHDHLGEEITDVQTFKNNGGLNFSQVSTITIDAIVLWLTTGDINVDGNPDLIVSAITDVEGTSGAAIYYGDGTGHYTTGPYIDTTTSNVLDIANGDLNGDGKPDLVVANDTSQNISVVLNTGGGTFGTPVTYVNITNPDHIRLADMDGDGKLDIVVGDRDPTYFTVLRNVNGLFPNQVQFQTGGSNFGGMAVGDLNRDGKPDVVIAMQFSGQVSVVLNTTPW